ncbi:MAG: glutamine-hydrolyzing GMP synthase, partial [Bryobacteraceae bacterium]|nr:glutamine-hydrolyzing GMP synthase [Bryobacteraceae bacterium]
TPVRQQIWMSHRDAVEQVPQGFRIIAGTDTCEAGAMVDTLGRLYGVQFHPEVVHTPAGRRILSNFVFDICGCRPDWEPKHQIPAIENRIREVAAGRSVFFFVSGGVDSTVAYTLCLRALGDARVHGAYVDTGLMREGETEYVKDVFASLGSHGFAVEDASASFLNALSGVRDPERKRHIIGEQFVRVQEEILERGHFLDSQWILGQGTIYPDTIESGGSANADLIKTHHNRVPGISELIASNRLVEPLHLLYKDEVREIGRELGLPGDLLDRHPFPGPGLAIRCLCSESSAQVERLGPGWLIPVRSVGVQGDCRTYMPVLSIGDLDHDQARRLINEYPGINRVVAAVASHAEIREMKVRPSDLSAQRLACLRRADAVVRQLSAESGFDRQVWQFPVVLIPLGTSGRPDSVVLRPIHSVDGMTAQSVTMDAELLQRMASELLRVEGLCGVFYDLTHKPPATIEWE